MKLLSTQTDQAILSRFGEEAVALVIRQDFDALAIRFGYALAWNREPAIALKDDCERAASSPLKSKPDYGVLVVVKYFKQNDTGPFALVECAIPLTDGGAVGMDLIVAGNGEEKSISVEDIYGEVY
jgi:hypothetical protein